MNSAIEELKEALNRLHALGHYAHGDDYDVDIIYNAAKRIGTIIQGCDNLVLAESWLDASKLIGNINWPINGTAQQIEDDIMDFIRKTEENEKGAEDAANRANEEAEDILNELGI